MCIFCKIVNKELHSNKVAENDEFMAFHDINPKAPVHVLAIPKKHHQSFNEISGDEMGRMATFIQEVAEKLDVKESGYRIISNIGHNGGQEVGHLHFHILGGARLTWGHFADSDPKEFF